MLIVLNSLFSPLPDCVVLKYAKFIVYDHIVTTFFVINHHTMIIDNKKRCQNINNSDLISHLTSYT